MVKAKERTKKIRRKIFRFSFGRISLRRRKIVRKTEKIEEIFQRILAALKLRKARGQRSSSEVGGQLKGKERVMRPRYGLAWF